MGVRWRIPWIWRSDGPGPFFTIKHHFEHLLYYRHRIRHPGDVIRVLSSSSFVLLCPPLVSSSGVLLWCRLRVSSSGLLLWCRPLVWASLVSSSGVIFWCRLWCRPLVLLWRCPLVLLWCRLLLWSSCVGLSCVVFVCRPRVCRPRVSSSSVFLLSSSPGPLLVSPSVLLICSWFELGLVVAFGK